MQLGSSSSVAAEAPSNDAYDAGRTVGLCLLLLGALQQQAGDARSSTTLLLRLPALLGAAERGLRDAGWRASTAHSFACSR